MQPDAVARLSQDRSAPTEPTTIDQPPPAESTSEASLRFLADLERRIGPQDFHHWFGEHILVRLDGVKLAIGVAAPFLLSWLQKTFRRPIQAAAVAVLGESAIVTFELSSQLSATRSTVREPEDQTVPANGTPPAALNPATVVADPPSPIPQATVFRKTQRRLSDLAEFVVAEEDEQNRLPLLAAKQVADHPGERQNPLFLYGSTGCGKTHLLEGICRRIQSEHRDLRVELLTAEKFTNLFTGSLHRKIGPQFRQRFRTVDVLLVDNVDFLTGKPGTQREFLHTFDDLMSRGRQVVLAAKCRPCLLTEICPDLTSRFAAGLMCRVELPDVEARVEICHRKANALGAKVKPAALRHVAERHKRSIREMLGAITTLATHYELTGKPICGQTAKRLLADNEADRKPPPTLKQIERAVCDFFHVRSAELRSGGRSKTVEQPRSLAIYFSREHTGRTYAEIATYYGIQTHTTAMRAARRIRDGLERQKSVRIANGDWPLSEVVEQIERKFA